MTGAAGSPRVHQVLATLGYGDAIGHEVLGIQRVLRGAGYRSEIFVETADPRLEDQTLDYREMIGATGRLYLSGTESTVRAAATAAEHSLEM